MLFEPALPFVLFEVTTAPPAPTVIVYSVPAVTDNAVPVLNPPAPPPETTRYSTEILEFGVTELLAELSAPVPALLVALTLNVYDVPFVRPVTVTGDDAPVPVNPPGVDVAV